MVSRHCPPPPAAHLCSIHPIYLPLTRHTTQTVIGAICGFIGSLVDSVVGGALQASWYCPERKTIVKRPSLEDVGSGAVRLISGANVLTNEQVNVISVSKEVSRRPYMASYQLCCLAFRFV